MANNFLADFPDVWAKEQQIVFYKTNVAMKIADTSFRGQMKSGDVLNRPYRSTNAVQTYTRGSAITIDDKTDTQEFLTVNRQFATGYYIDDFDAIQSTYDLAVSYGKDDGVFLSNQVDADVLGEVVNAASVVDDGTLGGTAGNGIALTTSNVLSVFGAAKKKMQKLNVPLENLFAICSPEMEQVLTEYGAGRDTAMGDNLNENGYMYTFYGFRLYRSNQSTGSAVLALATQPTANDTVTIAGQVFTFVAAIGTTAGNVLIGANVDATRANLATLINAPMTTTATGVAIGGATSNIARTFQNTITATNDNTANTLTVVAKGVDVLTVSETLTDATDTWTENLQKQRLLFGVMGNPVLVMQSDPKIRQKPVPNQLGDNWLNGVLYGVKTFQDNSKQMVDVQIKSSTY